MPKLLVTALAIAALLLAACGGGGSGDGKSASPEPSATAGPKATPKPYVFDDEPTPGPATGRVQTQISAICRLSVVDAEISATYKATVVGPPSTSLRRVRLMLNNKVADDSGDIFTRDYEANVSIHVSPGGNYSMIVAYVATGAAGPQILNVVRCPKPAGPGA